MSQTQHHFLPTLDANRADVPMPPVSAQWVSQPAGLLQSIGGGIAVDGTATTRGVSSVPDVWARALLFQTALSSERHPLHAEALADWRGLLSLLALREVYDYNVEVVPVDLAGGGKLSEALHVLAPPPVDLETGVPYAWSDVLLIRLDGVPVGAFSPSTLVYTATGYRDRLRAHYEPEGGEKKKRPGCLGPDYSLVAPTKVTDEFSAHFVGEYVHDLYEAVRGTLGTDPAAQRLSEQLRAWVDETRSAFGYSPDKPIDAPLVKVDASLPGKGSAADWPKLATYNVYTQTLRPLVQDGGGDVLRKSTLFLQHRRNHTDRIGVVVIHKDTLARTELVWGLRRLDSLGGSVQEALATHFNAPAGTTLAGENLDFAQAAWIRPERFFLTDVLLKPHEGTKALADGEQHANAEGNYVLPFRREVLDFFGPDDIRDVLKPRFERSSDGTVVTFSFDLPIGTHPDLAVPSGGDGFGGSPPPNTPANDGDPSISGGNTSSEGFGGGSRSFGGGGGFGGGASSFGPTTSSTPTVSSTGTFNTDANAGIATKTITIEREYVSAKNAGSDDAGTLVAVDLPVLDLFPDYLGPSWRRYFFFQSHRAQFDCRPYAHGAQLAVNDLTEQTAYGEHAGRVVEVYGDDAFPDGIEVRAADGTPGGVILTPRPTWDESGVSGSWTVGVDFGTSNTTVSRRVGSNTVKGWQIDFPAMLRPLTADPGGLRDVLLQAFFVPNRAVEFPVPTLLDVRHPNPESSDARVLLHYFAHFPPGYTWQRRVRSDIKWDGPGGRVTEFYLESLLLLILAEATRANIRHLDLRCTYPKVFSREQKRVLQNEWNMTLNTLTDPASEHIAVAPVDGLAVTVNGPAHYTEGRMAAEFFSSPSAIVNINHRAKKANAICVDVGGGTADLALLFDEDIVYDSSIHLAGKDIAAFLIRKPRLCTLLFSKEGAAALDAAREHERLFGARLNGVLRRENADIPKQLNRNSADRDVRRLRQIIALKFGALAFHTGTILGAAARHGVAPGLTDRLREGGISVHWGGNGSKLASWVDFGKFQPDGLMGEMMNDLLFDSLHDAEATPNKRLLVQAQSPRPKEEAAGGVAVYPVERERGGTVARIDGVICGETITLTDGREVDFLDSITLADLFDGDKTRFEKSSGERLKRFVSLFNKSGTDSGLLDADSRIPDDGDTMISVEQRARDHYVQMQNREESERSVEPVFIIEVRTLIEYLASA